jgi:hypothetical protein
MLPVQIQSSLHICAGCSGFPLFEFQLEMLYEYKMDVQADLDLHMVAFKLHTLRK